jgi:hypothetical protein
MLKRKSKRKAWVCSTKPWSKGGGERERRKKKNGEEIKGCDKKVVAAGDSKEDPLCV